jgi:hypothetical protein
MVSSGEPGPFDEDERAVARDWVEQIAERWRDAEEIGLDPALADARPAAAIALLDAVEDSWLLSLYGQPGDHEAMVTPFELSGRADAVAEDGRWDS